MKLVRLSLKSLKARGLTTALTLLSIAVSVSLLFLVEQIKNASQKSFTETISQTDLIVGARSGPQQLIMYTVFNMGTATLNLSYDSYLKIKNHPAVEWAVPISLGDSHKGFRVLGTETEFFDRYQFQGKMKAELLEGSYFESDAGLWNVVIGYDVYKNLNYKIGSDIVLSHGVTKDVGIIQHSDKPFKVAGILKKTGTILDQTVFVSLKAIEALHLDWQDGAMPTKDKVIRADQINPEQIKIETITAFFMRMKSKIDILRMQREINTFADEPLMAIIPGVVLNQLWEGLSYIENTLKLMSWIVVLIGMISMLIGLVSKLSERRREISILRAVGISNAQVGFMMTLEALILTIVGSFFGVFMSLIGVSLLKGFFMTEFGLNLQVAFTFDFMVYFLFILGFGLLSGLIPAILAVKLSLKDGLAPKL